MRATVMYEAGNVRVEDVPAPAIAQATDALVRIVRSCVCGSDLHPFHNRTAADGRKLMGHEFIGRVEAVGSEVTTIAEGDFVIAPFAYSCGRCEFCAVGLHTSCVIGGYWGNGDVGGGQAEYVRVPLADGTLVVVPGISDDSALLPSLLTLTDVYGTGYHAAKRANVGAGDTVVVIGDGAVGLMAVLSAEQLGAERIILMGHHDARLDLGRLFGATHVVRERGADGIAAVRELTADGRGAAKVLEAVGHMPAYEQAVGVVRPGGTIARVGVPQYQNALVSGPVFGQHITLTGGPAPVRAYIDKLLPAVLAGEVNPGLVFDRSVRIEDVAEGYQAMDARDALKVMIKF
ncbi:MAG: zinc-binding dehydrogenase [Agromyces sp.]